MTRDIQHSPLSDDGRNLRRTWHRLTAPSSNVTERDRQRQARFIAALLLSVMVLGVYGGLVAELYRPAGKAFRNAEFFITIGIMVVLGGLYILSRTRYHRWAAIGLITLSSLGSFAVAIPESGTEADGGILAYLVLPLVLSSYLLSLRTTSILAGAQLVGVMVFARFFELSESANLLGFLLVLSAVILYGAHYRNLIEQDRQLDLREAEERYRQLVELAPFTIAIHHKGKIAYINPAGVQMLGGGKREEFLGQPTINFVHPDYVHAAKNRISRTYNKGEIINQVEEKIIGLDGRVCDVETTLLPFVFDGETAAQIILRDLTEQHRAEAEQRASETQYRDLVENLPLGILRTTSGQQGRFAVANPACLKILGINSEAELRAIHMPDLFFDPAEYPVYSNRLAAEGSLTNEEVQIKRRDGTPIWVSFTAQIVYDEPGEVAYVDAVVEDITPRKEAAAAIQRNQAHLRALLDAIPELIFQLDRNGTFTSYHAPHNNTLLPPGEFLGKPIRDVLPDLADQALDHIERALATGDLQTYEYSIGTGDERRYFEARMNPCAEGEVVVVVRNITEWKRLTESLRREHDLVSRITETSPIAIVTLNKNGQITFANARAEALLGLSKDAMAQRAYNDPEWHITDYEGRPFPEERLPFARVMSTRQPVNGIGHAIEWPDGHRVLLSISGAPIMNESGEVEEVVVSMEDVTARIATEQTLRESEERYRSLFNNALTGFALHEIITDEVGHPIDYRFLEVNRRFEQLTGLRAEDVTGRCVSDILPALENAFIERYGRVALTGESIRFESYSEPLDRHYEIAAFSPRIGQFATLFLDITGRVKAQAELRDSEARYRGMVETQIEFVVRCKPDGTRTFVNDAYCHYFDQSREQLIGSNFEALVPPPAWESIQNKFARLTPEAPTATDIHQIYKPDGELAWHEWVDRGIFDQSGQLVEIQSVGRDVTERVQIADELRQERDRAQQYLDIAGVILVVLDTEGRIKLLNRKGREILGYSEQEILGQNWFECCLPPEEQEPVLEFFNQVIGGDFELPERFENHILTREGETRLIAWHNTPLFDDTGRVTGTLSSGEDITERERARRELIESEARYSALINASPSAILVMKDGLYTFANPTGAHLLGYDTPDEVVNLPVIETVAPASQALIRERLSRLAANKPNIPVEIDIMQPDGTTLTVESTSVPITLQGQPAILIIGQDISERKLVEEAEREARALSDALRDTAASLTRSLDREEVFERILTNIGKVIPHDAASIMLVTDREAVPVRAQGYEDFGSDDVVKQVRLPADEYPVFAEMFETRQVQTISDTHTDGRWRHIPTTEWIRSHITAPILIDNTIIGIISLDSATPNAFTPDHATRVGVFADQAAIAIQNANLYTEVQQHVSQLQALHQITLDVAAQIELDVLLNKLVENAIKLVNAQAGGIYLYRAEEDVLEWTVQAGDPDAMAPIGTRLQRGEGVAGKVWETRESLIVDDYSRWEGRSPQYDGLHFTAVIGVPITWDKQLLGVFNAVVDKTERTFSERDVQLLRLFVNQAAIALQKARMFDELEKRVHERTIDLSVRNRVAATLSRSLDSEVILRDVLETIVDQLEVSGGAIYLLTDDADSALELAASYSMSAEALNWVSDILPAAPTLTPGTSGSFSTVDMPYNGAIAAVLRVPIWRQDRIEGLIILVSQHTRPWRSADTRMLDAIGRQIAVAMHNARLYTQAFRSEARIRTILQSVADGLLVFNQNGELILMNPAAEALFAFNPDEQGGAIHAARRLWQWLHAQGSPQTIEFVLPTIPLSATAEIQCLEQDCKFRLDDGDLAWPCWLVPGGPDADHLHQCAIYEKTPTRSLQANSAEVRDTDQHVLGQVIALRDVTYFRELDDLKGMFVSTVSHELRTPLSVVLLQVSTLLRYYDRISDDERRRMVGEVQSQAHILRELIEDILELSRFDARRSLPDKQWFDLVAQCREVVESLEPAIQEKQLAVDLSGCTGLRYIHADMNQIMRVMRNLIGNAVKYTPADGQITLALSETNGMMRIDISDTGIGIGPEEQSRVFDRFFRSETAAHIAPGTGLGLSITREIIELHGGTIHLVSEPGKGSTFTVLLPIDSEE